MLEYAALSSSDPADLARQMTERSAQGWEILQIVSTGATVTAFVRRAAVAASIGATAIPSSATPSTATPTYASTAPTAATPVTTPSVASSVGDAVAPAAWYPDPSKRFELRYWNGTAWTEHVSRAGQQFTDPPVA
jgi:hypothetical protein